MTTVPTEQGHSHVRALLDKEIADADARAHEKTMEVKEAEEYLAGLRTKMEAAQARLAELRHHRSMVTGAPVPLTAREILTAQDGLGMRIGALTLGVRPDAQADDLERYANMMREVQAQALHQARLATDALNARGHRRDAPAVATCGECGAQITQSDSGTWLHVATRRAPCRPGDELSPHADPRPKTCICDEHTDHRTCVLGCPCEEELSPAALHRMIGKRVRVSWRDGGDICGWLDTLVLDKGKFAGLVVVNEASRYEIAPGDVAAIQAVPDEPGPDRTAPDTPPWPPERTAPPASPSDGTHP